MTGLDFIKALGVSVVLYVGFHIGRMIRDIVANWGVKDEFPVEWRRHCDSCRYNHMPCADMAARCGCALWESEDGC